MKKLLGLLLAAAMLFSLAGAPTALAEGDWTREGYFIDGDGNMLSVTWMDLEGYEGWYVACMLGEDPVEDSYGNILPQVGDSLHGNIVPDYEEGELIVTVSEEGEDGLCLAVEGGGSYHFVPMELDEAAFSVSINADGWGQIASGASEEDLGFDEGYFSSQVLSLAEPTSLVIGARPGGEDWRFVKWTKNGEDFSTEPILSVELTEDADFVAVFEYLPDTQNPVMNFIGEYACGSARALVEAIGDDGADITIELSNSDRTLLRWEIVGVFDEETMTVEYSNCVLLKLIFNERSELEIESIEYEDGTGRIVFDGSGCFAWDDDKSSWGMLVFEWVSDTAGIDYLALVNKLHPLPEGWEEALETVHVVNSVGDDVEVELSAYEAYLGLKEELEESEGIYLELDSARRSVAEQQDIMERFIEKYGPDYAAKTVAQPGYSEHHTGLALDLYFRLKNEDGSFMDVYYNEDMVQYPEIWEKIHARLADYGFILRYPAGSEHLTGYGYEPWHIRYLHDADAAREITERGVTLEEYLGAVKAGKLEIEPGSSALYTREQLEEAIVQIKCRFASFDGCELHSIRYAGDESWGEEDLSWANKLDPEGNYTQLALFLTDFHSPVEQVGAWEPNMEYTDYEWWLGLGEDGGWEILSFGYC